MMVKPLRLQNPNMIRMTLLGVLALVQSCAPTLAGNITSQDGAVIEATDGRINITNLKNPNGNSAVVKIDGGQWSTDTELAPGEYLVEALVPGYRLVSQRITLGETKKVSMVLLPIPKSGVAPIGANMDAEVGRGAGGATLTPPKL